MKASSILAWALALLLVGCKDENPVGEEGSPSNVIFPVSGVSYQYHVQPLFNQACNFSGCHGSDAPPNLVKLTSWGEMMTSGGGAGVVVPREPESSTLVLRIEGRGSRMPPSGLPLNQNQINGIRAWIVEGAKNN